MSQAAQRLVNVSWPGPAQAWPVPAIAMLGQGMARRSPAHMVKIAILGIFTHLPLPTVKQMAIFWVF